MKKVLGISFIFSVIVYLITAASTTSAIPAFARKYETSCVTCHVAFPKLNSFGEAFKRRGYRMPDDESYVKEGEEVKLGSPAWKKLWPKGIWPGTIPAHAPVAFIVPFSVNSKRDESSPKVDFAFPEGLQMLLGGTLGDSLSFYGDIALVEGREFGGIGRLFAQANMKNNLFNFRIGQFDISAIPFSGHRSLFLSDSILNSFNTTPQGKTEEHNGEGKHNGDSEGGNHDGEERHDEGDISLPSGHHSEVGLGASQIGMEIDGFKEGLLFKNIGFGYSFGLTNGNGTGGSQMEMEMEHGEMGHSSSFDNNDFKDLHSRIFFKFGGMGVLGGNDPEDFNAKNYFDISPSFQVGIFSTYGRNPVEFGMKTIEDRSRRLGIDATFRTQFFELSGAYMEGRNNFIGYGVEPVIKYTAKYLDASAITSWPWVIPAFRYDQISVEGLGSIDRFTPNLTLLLRANVKLVAENQWVRNLKNAGSTKISLVFAF